MSTIAGPSLSSLVREQIARPSPIRQIMKMAERQNILAMGLDPAQVISFGGGWVNHEAPDEFRQAYQAVVSDAELFHKSGAYTATLGDLECRQQIARSARGTPGRPASPCRRRSCGTARRRTRRPDRPAGTHPAPRD